MNKKHALGPQQKWSSKFGFIMAAVGSAVGLGNIWRFPYIVTAHGGALFMLVYLFIVVILGFMVMSAELTIGRYSGRSVIDAFRRGKKNWSFIGIISILICFLIVSYYSVIGGWITRYMFGYLGGGGFVSAGTLGAPEFYKGVFDNFTNNGLLSSTFNFLFLFCSVLVLVFGVKKGIEKVSKVLMPALFVMLIVVAIVSLTMDGAIEGLKFFFVPDPAKIQENGGVLGIINAAMGQAFFSLSVGIGINCTYGSYLSKDSNIPKDSITICGFDTLVAVVAGLAIIPAIFAAVGSQGLNGSVTIQGPGLIFNTLPIVFETIGQNTVTWFGNIMGFIFFLLVWVAALTSCISLLEVLISTIEQKLHIKRLWATLVVGAVILVTSTLVSYAWNPNFGLHINLLDLFDMTTVNYLMPIAAISMCLFITFIWGGKNAAREVTNNNADRFKKSMAVWQAFVMYICPLLIFSVFVFGLIDTDWKGNSVAAFSAMGLGIFCLVVAFVLGYVYKKRVEHMPLSPLGAHFDADAEHMNYIDHMVEDIVGNETALDGSVEETPQVEVEADKVEAEQEESNEENRED